MLVGILAGGNSSRFGSNKLNQKINNISILEMLYNELSNLGEIIISTQKGKEYIKDARYVYDENIGIGPLEGIYQLLKNTDQEYIAIVSGDTPFINCQMIEYLNEFISSDYDAYIYTDRGRVHPLCGIYKKSLKNIVLSEINNGYYSVYKMLSKIRTKYVEINDSRFRAELLSNINRPIDIMTFNRPIIAFSGCKNSGKTTLIQNLIPILSKEFINIGVVKHDGHDFDMDYENTDTYKYFKAGAKNIGITSNSKMAHIKYNGVDAEYFISIMKDCDLIILEGFKSSIYPKIELKLDKNNEEVKVRNSIAVATNIKDYKGDLPIFSLDDYYGIANFIIDLYKKRDI